MMALIATGGFVVHSIISGLFLLVRDEPPLAVLNLITLVNFGILWKHSNDTKVPEGDHASHLVNAIDVWKAGCLSIALYTVCAVLLLRI